MVNKRFFLLIAMLTVVISSVAAQEKTTLDKLAGKEWFFVRHDNEVCGEIYSIAGMVKYFYESNASRNYHEGFFYLSDSIDSVFDESKIGKAVNGKYIVYPLTGVDKNGNEYKSASVCEILELTDNKLVIEVVRFKSSPWNVSIFTYVTK